MDTTSDFSALKSIPFSTFNVPKDFSIPFACIMILFFLCKGIYFGNKKKEQSI